MIIISVGRERDNDIVISADRARVFCPRLDPPAAEIIDAVNNGKTGEIICFDLTVFICPGIIRDDDAIFSE